MMVAATAAFHRKLYNIGAHGVPDPALSPNDSEAIVPMSPVTVAKYKRDVTAGYARRPALVRETEIDDDSGALVKYWRRIGLMDLAAISAATWGVVRFWAYIMVNI
jgi:hypothetical protein